MSVKPSSVQVPRALQKPVPTNKEVKPLLTPRQQVMFALNDLKAQVASAQQDYGQYSNAFADIIYCVGGNDLVSDFEKHDTRIFITAYRQAIEKYHNEKAGKVNKAAEELMARKDFDRLKMQDRTEMKKALNNVISNIDQEVKKVEVALNAFEATLQKPKK